MKRKTYKNFILIMDMIQDLKHYNPQEAERLTRKVFENVEADKGPGKLNRSAEYFIDMILPAEEFYAEYGA